MGETGEEVLKDCFLSSCWEDVPLEDAAEIIWHEREDENEAVVLLRESFG